MRSYKQSGLVFLAIITCAALLIGSYRAQEGFRRLMPGDYPVSDDKPLLYDVYKERHRPTVTADNISQVSKDYPLFPAHSVETTNIRQWKSPDNGTCIPTEFCNALYEDLPAFPASEPLQTPTWGDKRLRINFYFANQQQA
jgi:hypothetical protein